MKFQDNKDQFHFNSELQGRNCQFLGCEKVKESRNNLRHRQKIISLLIRVRPVGQQSKNTKPRSLQGIQWTTRLSRKPKKASSEEEEKLTSKEPRKTRILLVLLVLALVMIGCSLGCMLTALSLIFSAAGKCSHFACLTVCVLLLCVSVLENVTLLREKETSTLVSVTLQQAYPRCKNL